MSNDNLVEQSMDRAQEAPSKASWAPGDTKSLQEDAAAQSSERRQFLSNSLGRGNSPSTEILKDMIVNIYDGARQVVGLDAGVPDSSKVENKAAQLVAPRAAEAVSAALPDTQVPADAKNTRSFFESLGDKLSPEARKHAGLGAPFEFGMFKDLDKYPEQVREETVKPEREHLMKVAEARMKNEPPERLQQFRKDMEELEKRGQTSEPKLSPEEIAKTYKEVARIMETKGAKHTSEGERLTIAQQVMHQAAHPTEVNQGQHGTCNVATVESRLYTKNPSAVAHVVAEAAIEGKYTTNPPPPEKPITVNIPEKSLKQTGESSIHPPQGGDRSYASQIFQVTAANIAWERHNDKQPPGSKRIRYEQREESDPGTAPHDSGDRLVDYTDPKNPKVVEKDGKPRRGPDVYANEIVAINEHITGASDQGSVIQSHKFGERGCTQIKDESDLNKTLSEAKRDGKLPLTVMVHTGKEPFLTDSGHGKAGGSGGWHVVNVTDYVDGPPAKVKVDNQWGPRADHLRDDNMVPLSDLHKAMTSPHQDKEDEVKDLQKQGRDATVPKMDLLEMGKKDGGRKEKDYEEKLVQIMVDSEKHWKKVLENGPPSEEAQADHERANERIMKSFDKLPKAQRQKVFEKFQKEVKKGH